MIEMSTALVPIQQGGAMVIYDPTYTDEYDEPMSSPQLFVEYIKSLKGIESKKNFLFSFATRTRRFRDIKQLGVNQLLVIMYQYAGQGEVKTFLGWKDEGREVVRGAKALLLYSKPIEAKEKKEKKASQKKEKKENGEGNGGSEEGNYKFWSISHVFSENDTEAIR